MVTRRRERLSEAELQVRKDLADGLSFVRSRETTKSLGAVTFEEVIAEQIFFLDDSEAGEESDAMYSPFARPPRGYLQELNDLEARLLGSDGTIQRVREGG